MNVKEALLTALEEITGLEQNEFEADMDFDLLENDILDSVSCAALRVALEDKLGRKFRSERLVPEDYTTPNTLLAAVEKNMK